MTASGIILPGVGEKVATDEVTWATILQHIQALKIVLGAEGDVDGFLCFAEAVRYFGTLAAGALTGSMQDLLTPGVPVRIIRIFNWTDGDVIVSLDAGSTEHFTLSPGKTFEETYGASFLRSTDAIHVQQGTKTPANGSVFALAYGTS